MSLGGIAPELNADVLVNITNLLPLSQVCRLEQVSKFWKGAVQDPLIWVNQSEKNYVPLVDGPHRDRKRDFKILFQMTFGPLEMGPLGKFRGVIQNITQEDFNRSLKNDPFEPAKKVFQTFRLVIEPEFIERDYDQQLVNVLTDMGDFDTEANISADKSKILIPYSLRNVELIAEHFPLSRKSDGTVFYFIEDPVYEQCSTVANKVRMYFMRVEVPEETFGLSPDEQEKLMRGYGFEMPRLSPRLFSDVLDFLNHGKNADSSSETRRIQTRTSDTILQNGIDCPVIIGDFISDIEEKETNHDESSENDGFPPDESGVTGGYVIVNNKADKEVGTVPGWPAGNSKENGLSSSSSKISN